MPRLRSILAATFFGLTAAAAETAVLRSSFIADKPPTRSSHASTVVETPEGVAAAWFGGTAERVKDVVIWFARLHGDTWSTPVEIARGNEDPGAAQYACWNPVLFQQPGGSLYLFYKVGPSPDTWWGRVQESTDGGKTWSRSRRLPEGQVGPVRNKPILLEDGTLLCGSSTEDSGWRVHMERSRAPFTRWERTPPLNTTNDWGAIQPTLLPWPGNRIQILVRTRQRVIAESWSQDDGRTWSPMAKISLPNPNSGIDAVRLRDGRALLIYNPDAANRATIGVGISKDGTDWRASQVLETTSEPGTGSLAHNPGELSYPAVIQARDGKVHVTYTWKRERIRHLVLDPSKL
jgi:predicted neuraminidase